MKLSDFDFRIWDNHNKKYIDNISYSIKKYQNENKVFLPFSIDLSEYGNNEIFKDEIQMPSDRVEIELWTGFYDKNGKKIYENDILKNEELEEFYHITRSNTAKMFKIKFFEKNPEGKLIRVNGSEYLYFFKIMPSNKYSEVIGNIHENADLLEVKELK
ncbi:TPA: hypothetical protein RTG68_001623 [Campylobacter jejuni]|nr:hypothetical protein [Campylobacter jejuni]HDZ5014898.1 hypothetical protein [Campylobacter jejuni]HDZ5039459.1 hypothetical protein [Campylobacter jejuni]HDZ5051148.1 hypothetical protein [Campylobacter jejuni]